jgi:hypothetical protein
MDAKVILTTYSGVVSGIALAAPALIQNVTSASATTPFGVVDSPTGGYVGGTSFSAPLVSGAALLLKESFLRIGGSWINSPGRLFAVMLAMGDGWRDSSNSYTSNGADKRSGFGRLKMRLLIDPNNPSNPTLPNVRTRATSHTSTGNNTTSSILLWSSPLPETTRFLKCVLHEAEDMSIKEGVSDVYLSVRVLQPVGGICSTSGALVGSRTDGYYDLKHIAHVEHGTASNQMDLTGNCVVADIVSVDVHPGGSSQILFCYSSNETHRQ